MTPTITMRQRRILTFITQHVGLLGYPPSVREIGEAVGLSSTSSVAHQLWQLELKGYLRRAPHRSRALSVTDPAEIP